MPGPTSNGWTNECDAACTTALVRNGNVSVPATKCSGNWATYRNAYIWANTRKGGWHSVHSYVLTGTIINASLRQKEYTSMF